MLVALQYNKDGEFVVFEQKFDDEDDVRHRISMN
jgi:hypothetical protein